MTEGTTGLIFVLTLAVGSSLIWHWLVRSYLAAAALAVGTTVVAFHAARVSETGYIDATIVITMVTTAVIAAVAALLIGLPFRARRTPQQRPPGQHRSRQKAISASTATSSRKSARAVRKRKRPSR